MRSRLSSWGLNIKDFKKGIENIDDPSNFTCPVYPESSSHVFGLQTSFNLLMEVMANFAQSTIPSIGITYFSAQVGRLSPELSELHPEILLSLFTKANSIMDESHEAGLKLFGALGVIYCYLRSCFSFGWSLTSAISAALACSLRAVGSTTFTIFVFLCSTIQGTSMSVFLETNLNQRRTASSYLSNTLNHLSRFSPF